MARNQNWKAGLFVIFAAVTLAAAVVLVAGIRMSSPRNRYTIRFAESVSGLEPGAAVKYRGVAVGRVDEIRIPEDDITKVEVAVSIDDTRPIRTDTKAVLSTIGITGIKFVDLQTGSTVAPPLPPGSAIPSQPSLLESLGATAQTATEKIDILLENLLYMTDREKVDRLAARFDEFAITFKTMDRAAAHVDTMVRHVDRVLSRNEGKVDSSLASLDRVLAGAEQTFDEIERTQVFERVSAAAAGAGDAASDLHGILSVNRRSISETLANLRETAANLSDFSRLIRDRPSLLLRSSPPESPDLPGAD